MRTTLVAALATLTLLASMPDVHAQGQGPCGLLTMAEVQQAFPSSKPGKLDRSQEKNGILSCVWDNPIGLLQVVVGTGEETQSPREEAEGWLSVFVDPLRSDAERRVRYEVLPGVGDAAVAVVEREDKTKGFYQNGAILAVRRGKRVVSVLSSDLARRERADALRILTELGKAIAKRLE